jgi:hypothetical protein
MSSQEMFLSDTTNIDSSVDKTTKKEDNWSQDYLNLNKSFKSNLRLRSEKQINRSIERFKKECPKYYEQLNKYYTDKELTEPRFGHSITNGEYEKIAPPIEFYKIDGKADNYLKTNPNLSIMILEIIRNYNFKYSKAKPYEDHYPKYMHLTLKSAVDEYQRKNPFDNCDIITEIRTSMKDEYTKFEKRFSNHKEKLKNATNLLMKKENISHPVIMSPEAIHKLGKEGKVDVNGRHCILCKEIGPYPYGILCGNESGINSGRKHAVNPIKGYHMDCIRDQIIEKSENLLCFVNSFLCPRTHCNQNTAKRRVNFSFHDSRVSRAFLKTVDCLVQCSNCLSFVWKWEGSIHECQMNKPRIRIKIEQKIIKKENNLSKKQFKSSSQVLRTMRPENRNSHSNIKGTPEVSIVSKMSLRKKCKKRVSKSSAKEPTEQDVIISSEISEIDTPEMVENIDFNFNLDEKQLKKFLNPTLNEISLEERLKKETFECEKQFKEQRLEFEVKITDPFGLKLSDFEETLKTKFQQIGHEMVEKPQLFKSKVKSRETGQTLLKTCCVTFDHMRHKNSDDMPMKLNETKNSLVLKEELVDRLKDQNQNLIKKNVTIDMRLKSIENNIQNFFENQFKCVSEKCQQIHNQNVMSFQNEMKVLKKENQDLKEQITVFKSSNKKRKSF